MREGRSTRRPVSCGRFINADKNDPTVEVPRPEDRRTSDDTRRVCNRPYIMYESFIKKLS